MSYNYTSARTCGTSGESEANPRNSRPILALYFRPARQCREERLASRGAEPYIKSLRFTASRMVASTISVQKFGAAAFSLSVLVAFYSQLYNDQPLVTRNVLDGLLRAERNATVRSWPRVAVGFGSCLDGLVDGVRLLRSLRLKPPHRGKHHGTIESEKEFSELFAYFFEPGAAAE